MSQSETYFASAPEESHMVTDNVKFLASNVYQEFERMIKKYDADVVKDLMPIIISILENLDQTNQEKHTFETDLELLKSDNEQLLIQYEKEKQMKKAAEQKCIEIEDLFETERRQLQEKLENMESNIRLSELKAKNAQHNVSRLEEKENDSKKEYLVLHERYTELLKTHMEYIERMRLNNMEKSQQETCQPQIAKSLPSKATLLQSAVIHSPSNQPNVPTEFTETVRENVDMPVSTSSLKDELLECELTVSTDDSFASGGNVEKETDTINVPEDQFLEDDLSTEPSQDTKRYKLPETSLFAELSLHDADVISEVDSGSDLTAFSREVEHLIQENNELLVRKNALNVVNKDLIARLDDMASEQEVLRHELTNMQTIRDKLKARVCELEEDLAKVKEALQKQKEAAAADAEEADEERAQRKRFTRMEMARVVTERNQYKERLMELQEAVRWTEMMRVSREHPDAVTDGSTLASGPSRKRTTIWNYFSGLLPSAGSTSTSGSPTKHASASTKTQIV